MYIRNLRIYVRNLRMYKRNLRALPRKFMSHALLVCKACGAVISRMWPVDVCGVKRNAASPNQNAA